MPDEGDPERDAAFALANDRRRRDAPPRFDRKIYVVDRVERVRGGLPTHGSRR